jgi:hypothetical protein
LQDYIKTGNETKKDGFDLFENLGDLVKSEENWKPHVSERVTNTVLGLDGAISAASLGLPIEAKSAIKFTSETSFGAIVMSDAKVEREYYEHPKRFQKWLAANAERLLMKYPDIEDHGLYLVVRTYSSYGDTYRGMG